MSRSRDAARDTDKKIAGAVAWLEAVARSRARDGLPGTSSRVVVILDFDGPDCRRSSMTDGLEVHDALRADERPKSRRVDAEAGDG